MNELTQLLGGGSGLPAQIVSWLLIAQAVLKAAQPLLSRGVTALADRLDDMIDRGRTDGALLLALVRSHWWIFAVFAFDLLFRLKLPTEASLEARWDRIKQEKEKENEAEKDAVNPNLDGTGLMALIAALGLGLAVFTGCGTPEQTAFRTIGGTAHTVDTAMNAWGDWVRAGKATPEAERRVEAAYVKYQAAMDAVEAQVVAAKSLPDGTPAFVGVPAILSSSASELVALIHQLAPPEKR